MSRFGRVRIQSDGTDAGTLVTLVGGDGEVTGVIDYTIEHPLGERAIAVLTVLLPQVDVEADVTAVVGRFPVCGHTVECAQCAAGEADQ